MFKQLAKVFSKSPPETKATTQTITVGRNSFLNYILSGGERITASQAMTFYRTSSAVATAVDLIAESFEQINPVLQTEEGFTSDHELINKLKNPNGFDSWSQFAGAMSRHYLLKHDSHIAGLGNISAPPIELYALKPQNISTIEDSKDNYPASYYVSQGPGNGHYNRNDIKQQLKIGARYYDGNLKELYHIMGFSSRSNNIEGDSPLEAAALDVRSQIKGRIHNVKLLENGGRLSYVFAFEDEARLDDDEHRERTRRVNEELGGADNAGKIATISGTEVKITELGTSNKDMDYETLEKTTAQAIYLRYKIPLPLVSNDASTFNNMRTAIEFLYDLAVLPHADIMFAGLSKMLLMRYKLDPQKYKITYDPESITALMERRLVEIERRRKINIETIDELREMLPGAKGEIEGGNVLYQPANLIPIGTEIEEETISPEEEAEKLLARDGIKQ